MAKRKKNVKTGKRAGRKSCSNPAGSAKNCSGFLLPFLEEFYAGKRVEHGPPDIEPVLALHQDRLVAVDAVTAPDSQIPQLLPGIARLRHGFGFRKKRIL